MKSANVFFSRAQGHVEMVLEIDCETVARTSSPESIVMELQIREVRELHIEGKFSTYLPTSEKALTAAAEIPFTEMLSVLRLLAACSYMGEFPSIAQPERRKKPKADGCSPSSTD
ncbi:hypothetical protein GTP46_11235 [Duganella sp. FT135W]|uniref:Uncharacterized protein n=1 Tax=Duganella flavida TaxID=2692175 RepID=A0A6L8K6S9_9BURK|nr:hypothetical protein [Duganella flavida]MYM23219.1 hypothetical protein [Duganella flavida]